MAITKKEYFATVRTIVEASDVEGKADLLNFIDHEVELLNRKSAKSGQTKTQKENVAVKESIAAAMAELDKPVTVTEIMAVVGLSNQKISALLRQMISEGTVVKTTDKKKSYFSLASAE